jgi:hypothetical protein
VRNQYHLEKQQILQFHGKGYRGINWVDSKKGRAPTAKVTHCGRSSFAHTKHTPPTNLWFIVHYWCTQSKHFRQSIIIIIINHGESACRVEPLCHQLGAPGACDAIIIIMIDPNLLL